VPDESVPPQNAEGDPQVWLLWQRVSCQFCASEILHPSVRLPQKSGGRQAPTRGDQKEEELRAKKARIDPYYLRRGNTRNLRQVSVIEAGQMI
jgi:hypothetical protein